MSMVLNGLSRPCHNTPFTGNNRLKTSFATLKVPRVEKEPGFADSSVGVCFTKCATDPWNGPSDQGECLEVKSAIRD